MIRLLLALFVFATATTPAGSQPAALENPAGEVILTVEGNIERTNRGDSAEFDRAMLERLPQQRIATKTPWGTQVTTFEGPALAEVLDQVGARGTTLHATALNDYRAEIPISDLEEHGVILALKADGNYLSVRDKGPLWIIYPLDRSTELTNTAPEKMVWQLSKLRVE